ncbi:hypothetical protein EYF80_035651 [Liparis tanakae]|uniref:Uncharacterized protein n=1 Tax=Liparis tanakae TaxID=230148 RepID=A0A4Z2GMW9_9TELE|nr:hypothetical protein EYF80_035651 [Liparis tanakae]
MSELVPVDVPPLHAVLMRLQGDGRFCGRMLELKEEREQSHTTPPMRTTGTEEHPPPPSCQYETYTHSEAEVVHVPVGGAVDGPFSGEVQRVEERLALDTQGAAQLEEGVADPTGPVVHQLEEGNEQRKLQYATYEGTSKAA